MFETYRMLGREREKERESEAVRLRPLAGRPVNRISVVTAAVVVAALAFGATVTRAEVWPDGSSGAQLTTQPSSPDLVERWVASHKTPVLAPPDLIERWVASHKTPVLAPPDLIERWVASHERQVVLAPRPVSNSRAGEAFDWRAAFVGASATAALALALGIGIGIARRFQIRSAA